VIAGARKARGPSDHPAIAVFQLRAAMIRFSGAIRSIGAHSGIIAAAL
jgi:uridine phosphorylase